MPKRADACAPESHLLSNPASVVLSESTNWDQYYRSPVGLARVTRWLSSRRILRLLRRYSHSQHPLSICELGGANSCFLLPLCRSLPISRYHIIDTCRFGLLLLASKQQHVRADISWELGDVLLPQRSGLEAFDLVFSVGLIEHFDPINTSRAIAAHFARVRPGGLVLITFPTPTLVYRILRGLVEHLGQWKFPDERPLLQQEVRDCCRGYGVILHESLHSGSVFTQGYILVRACGSEAH